MYLCATILEQGSQTSLFSLFKVSAQGQGKRRRRRKEKKKKTALVERVSISHSKSFSQIKFLKRQV